MKILHILILVTAIFIVAVLVSSLIGEDKISGRHMQMVNPVSHASFVLRLEETIIYNDPVGEIQLYESYEKPDLVLLSDIHEDHLDITTLVGVVGEDTVIVASNAVTEKLPLELQEKTVSMNNGDFHQVDGISIEAIPMYNLPPSEDAYHIKGRGNGYVLGSEETRVYIAGDTSDIPEMRALEDIDLAFIPMNLPYTMDVDVAADAVLDFAPSVVYPYHYRDTDGLSDIAEFARLVGVGNTEIEVKILDWYPDESVFEG